MSSIFVPPEIVTTIVDYVLEDIYHTNGNHYRKGKIPTYVFTDRIYQLLSVMNVCSSFRKAVLYLMSRISVSQLSYTVYPYYHFDRDDPTYRNCFIIRAMAAYYSFDSEIVRNWRGTVFYYPSSTRIFEYAEAAQRLYEYTQTRSAPLTIRLHKIARSASTYVYIDVVDDEFRSYVFSRSPHAPLGLSTRVDGTRVRITLKPWLNSKGGIHVSTVPDVGFDERKSRRLYGDFNITIPEAISPVIPKLRFNDLFGVPMGTRAGGKSKHKIKIILLDDLTTRIGRMGTFHGLSSPNSIVSSVRACEKKVRTTTYLNSLYPSRALITYIIVDDCTGWYMKDFVEYVTDSGVEVFYVKYQSARHMMDCAEHYMLNISEGMVGHYFRGWRTFVEKNPSLSKREIQIGNDPMVNLRARFPGLFDSRGKRKKNKKKK
jgi:hypothetical protein